MPKTDTLQIRVRYAETDQMGFVHHSRYFEYFEMGRTEMLRKTGPRYRDLEEQGYLLALAKAECRFRYPARYDELLTLKTTLQRITRAKIVHTYELFNEQGRLCTEGETTLVCIDPNGALQPMPRVLLETHSKNDGHENNE